MSHVTAADSLPDCVARVLTGVPVESGGGEDDGRSALAGGYGFSKLVPQRHRGREANYIAKAKEGLERVGMGWRLSKVAEKECGQVV